nr:hypothetical protein [Tanacetum cinerariifolium]
MDMLNTRNETMILGRPFLGTIHAEIDVFNKEISLGIGGDRVTFDMSKKILNFTTLIGEIYMINSTYNSEYTFHTSSYVSSRIEKTDDLHNKNNYCNKEQGRSYKKLRKLKFNITLPNTYFCKPVKQIRKGELKFWPTCDPNIRECNGGPEIYGMDEEGVMKKCYFYHDDDKKRINRGDLVKDRRERSFDDYKWMFDLEVDQLADEYELGIGKKGHMLDDIYENYKKVQGDNTYWWHNYKSEEEERRELGINIEESRQWKEDLQKDVERLESNLKTWFSLQGSEIRGLLDSFLCGSKVLSWCNHIGYAVTDIITT